MGKKISYVAPISIDLGAANTGVYSAFYKEGASPEGIEREGTVYRLGKDDYTLLMAARTATRHQRRGIVRRKLAKRLFKLIWEKEFRLGWTDEISQSLGFLFNRRGFNFLQEEYDAERLSQFPKEAWEELPEGVKALLPDVPVEGGECNLEHVLQRFAQEGFPENLLEELCVHQKKVANDLVYYDRSIRLKKYCEAVLKGEKPAKTDKKIQSISFWIAGRWASEGVVDLCSGKQSHRSIALEEISDSQELMQAVADNMPDYGGAHESCKDSVWNFKVDSINLESMARKEEKVGKQGSLKTKNDLHNLVYAFHSVDKELRSGAKYRKKYLEEVQEILEKKDHSHQYLRIFVQDLHAGRYAGKTAKELAHLIGHISNLELKPLRKYFNNKEHAGGDLWDSEALKKRFSRWLLKEWRINPVKNPEKAEGESQDYRALCCRWKEHEKGGGSVVAFWMGENPVFTISPYQNNNNRRPPRCQSLVLSGGFLEREYPAWQGWLNLLKGESSLYLDGFEAALKGLETGRGFYFCDSLTGEKKKDSQRLTRIDLEARIFQFILDRRKKSDPFKLNDIYSCAKKIRQLKQKDEASEEWNEKLQEAIRKSTLPDVLKTHPNFVTDDLFPQATFLHLICRYYKLRQRARDGRVYIHPEYRKSSKRGYEKTNRFTDDMLLRYCNLKPRQKKYQSFMDVASIFQISSDLLGEKVGSRRDEDLQAWLKGFRGLSRLCEKSSEAQKDYRGSLKTKLAMGNDKALVKLQKDAKGISRKIAEVLFDFSPAPEEGVDKVFDSRVQKFESIFSFAQLQNIAFVERNGNSNTCPICSLDNGKRMETVPAEEGEMAAKAQRLPSVVTRIIDGAVMRLARILAKRIVDDRWTRIEGVLQGGEGVRIPIITESNQFEFEPSLRELKSKTSKDGAAKEPTFDDKLKRIKEAGKNICPYNGTPVGEAGELDHIIPRTSSWGTLNDETNLIYASKDGNNRKLEREYFLADLHPNYKKAVFKTEDDEVIEGRIASEIWDGERKCLSFGKYRSFINLDRNQQLAFRHALFSKNKELRNAVINEINNRRRTLVNGTQRYFAEVLANEFHKRALGIGKGDLLDFDYFSVDAFSNSQGDSVRDFEEMTNIKECRAILECFDKDVEKDQKKEGQSQKPYSHLLDAMIAFLISADRHRNEGSLGLNIPDDKKIVDVDRESGELREGSLFKDVWVEPDKMNPLVELKRKAPRKDFREHRAFTRDGLYADRYFPVLMRKVDGKTVVRVGFSWKNSVEWLLNKKDKGNFFKFLRLCKQRREYPSNFFDGLDSADDVFNRLMGESYFQAKYGQYGHISLSMDRFALHEYWMERHNSLEGNTHDAFFKFCYSEMGYRTEKQIVVLNPQDGKYIEKVLKDDKNFTCKFKGGEIILPCRSKWQDCWESWRHLSKNGGEDKFFKDYFLSERKQQSHQRARKVFSLPIRSSGGMYLLKRKGWDGSFSYQLVNDSDSRSVGNKASCHVMTEDGTLKEMLNPWTRSKTLVKLPPKSFVQEGQLIDPERWFEVDRSLDLEGFEWPAGCEKVELQLDNVTRPKIRITLSCDGKDFDRNILKENDLCKGRFEAKDGKDSQVIIKEFWEKSIQSLKEGESFEYRGDGLKQLHKSVIQLCLKDK